jgi:SAM-dependent methyltransferase
MNETMKGWLESAASAVGYNKMHITRTVAYREIDQWLNTMPCDKLEALEISAGWKWRDRAWQSFSEMNWPEHDICKDQLDRTFDLIIADNVWEHLLHPYRAARNVYAMLRPGGWFVNITPFMIRNHPIPIDCSRWTELGMKHFLEEAGFDPEHTMTGSWGNAAAVKANLYNWGRVGWRRAFPNDVRFPVTVWAMAQKR